MAPGFGFGAKTSYAGFLGAGKNTIEPEHHPGESAPSDNNEGSYSGFGTSSADSHSESDTAERHSSAVKLQQQHLSPDALRKVSDTKVIYSDAAAKMMVRLCLCVLVLIMCITQKNIQNSA